MNRYAKEQIVKCLVSNVILYAAETWTISNTYIKRIEAFEMWLCRKIEKISQMVGLYDMSQCHCNSY